MRVQLSCSLRLCAWVVVCLAAGALHAVESVKHPHQAGFSGSLGFDYDGSRYRNSAFGLNAEVEWGNSETWITLSLDAYSDFSSQWRFRSETYATLELGHALYRNNDTRLYVNASLELDAHSRLATRGGDVSPALDLAKGLTEDWWIGGSIGAVLAMNPDEGYRRGYGSVSLWVTYLSGWLPDESDSISLSISGATNEDTEADKALFITLEYDFDIADDWEVNLGLGTDPSSPWDHLGVYATAGITWRF